MGTRCGCGQGCKTFGQCIRNKGLRVGYCRSAAGYDKTTQNKWDSELSAYRAARAEGIQPDGTSVALWNDIRRLRYRESLREAKLVKPGEIVKYDFDPGLFVARRLMKGSRLRLVVYTPNSIFWQKNYNSGGAVADETAKDARTAHVKVYHDAQHASAIELPLR